jgi:hypothetical protein
MPQYTLIEGLEKISLLIHKPVSSFTSISYEDGTGRRFNYKLIDNGDISYYIQIK